MPEGRGSPVPRREFWRPAHRGRQMGRATAAAAGDDQIGHLCTSWQALRFEKGGMSDDSRGLSMLPASDALSSSGSVANNLATTSGVREESPLLSLHMHALKMGCHSVEDLGSSSSEPFGHRQLLRDALDMPTLHAEARTMLWALLSSYDSAQPSEDLILWPYEKELDEGSDLAFLVTDEP
jgi:hypothetical protein